MHFRFPEYIFYGDPNIAKSASVGQRYSTESLKGVVLDIHMLSKCDYLVCTFSSQVNIICFRNFLIFLMYLYAFHIHKDLMMYFCSKF